MESGKDPPSEQRSSSEREFECHGCGAKNLVKKSEGTPTNSTSSRKRRWMEAAATASEAAGVGGREGSRRGNRLLTARARKLNGEQGRTDGFL